MESLSLHTERVREKDGGSEKVRERDRERKREINIEKERERNKHREIERERDNVALCFAPTKTLSSRLLPWPQNVKELTTYFIVQAK